MEQQATTHPSDLVDTYRELGYVIAGPHHFRDLAEVKEANARTGKTWFGRDEMKFFGTRYLTLHAGCILSFADRNFDGSALDYKVAFLSPVGDVITVLDPKFPSRLDAKKYANSLVDELRKRGVA